ncbi:hypothetical protein KA005_49755, partial [bacterium]|nr:hypothetical protein [bacterium]
NEHKAFLYYGKEVFGRENFPWDFSGLKGKQQQRGVGWHTLCGKCNNNTGRWYGEAFIDFTYQGYKGYQKLLVQKKMISRKLVTIDFYEIYPLRIIKQIIAMFFSINSSDLSAIHPELRAFVLNKEKRGISSKKFNIYLYVLIGTVARYLGITSILKLKNTENIIRVLSELSAPPFGYVFEIDPKVKEEYSDITFFANNFSYDKKVNLSLTIPIYESNTVFHADYRTKQEIMNDYIKNKLLKLRNKK